MSYIVFLQINACVYESLHDVKNFLLVEEDLRQLLAQYWVIQLFHWSKRFAMVEVTIHFLEYRSKTS